MVEKNNAVVNQGHTYFQWMIALIVNLASLSYGMECGWISPTSKILKSNLSPTGAPLSDTTIGWIASSMNIAAACGVPIFAFIADRYGRKFGVLFITLPQMISWIIRASFSSTTSLIIARAISGIAAGGIFNIIPMYVKEISQENIRGSLGSLLVLSQNIGILIMYIIGAYLNYYTVIYIVLCVPVLVAIFMIKAPETPEFLVKQNKVDEAEKTLAFLRGLNNNNEVVQNEIANIKAKDDQFKSLPEISLKSIVKEKFGRRVLILFYLMLTCQAYNGSIVMITYAFPILVSTEANFGISPEIQTISIPCMMIISSFTLILLIERFDRKKIVVTAHIITGVSSATLGSSIMIKHLGGSIPSWLPVLVLVLVVMMYAGAIAPIPYIIMTEILNFQMRAKVIGLIVSYGWFSTFISISTYPLITKTFGQYTAFYFYATTNTLAAIFISLCIPETKGKSEEDICLKILGRNKDIE